VHAMLPLPRKYKWILLISRWHVVRDASVIPTGEVCR